MFFNTLQSLDAYSRRIAWVKEYNDISWLQMLIAEDVHIDGFPILQCRPHAVAVYDHSH